MIPEKLDNPYGLHRKYLIEKHDGYSAFFYTKYADYPVQKWCKVSVEDIDSIHALNSDAHLVKVLIREDFKEVDKDAEYFVFRLDKWASLLSV